MIDLQEPLLTYDNFVEAANTAIAAACTSRRSVALLVADVDHHKRTASVYGEQYAQQAMQDILGLVRRTLRRGDVASHPSGDELVVLLHANAAEAHDVAERLASAVRGHEFPPLNDGSGTLPPARLTISVGVAVAPEHGSTYATLHAAADAARVRLKAQGRDGAATAPEDEQEPPHRPLDVDRFAGRAEELRTLSRLVDDAMAGHPNVVGIIGDIGTGTATLVRQLEPEIRLRGGSLVHGRCRNEDMREPYGVWMEVLAAIQRLPEPTPDLAGESWRELQYLIPGEVGTTPVGDGSGTKYRLLEELREHIRTVAEARPLVILLDEMQWADAASWDALEHVVEQLDNDRILICVTVRSDPSFAEAAERRRSLARSDFYQEIQLSRLTRDEVKRWLEAAFHNQEIGREFLAFLYRHTEGNPLFLAELLRALLAEGALWHADGRWEWSPVSELRLPAGLTALISRRLNRFSSTTQTVLTTAAVIGREFDIGLVVAAGAGSEAAVQLALSEALAAGMLRPTYERDGGGYAFTYEQAVEVLSNAIPRDQLRHIHERVAAALERRRGARPAEIATHYDRAGASAPAYRYAMAASARAELVHAHAAASDFLHVAARNATSPAELAEVRIQLAQLAERLGRFDEAEELCDLAIDWYEGQGDRRRVLTVRRMRERARKELGQPARVMLETLQALDDEATELGFESERVAILTMLSQAHGRMGDRRAAENVAEQAVRIAQEVGDEGLLAEALNRLGSAVEQDTPERAEEINRRALEIYERTGDVRGQARCHNNIANVALHGARWSEARDSYLRALTLARAAGLPDLSGLVDINLGVIAHRSGEYDKARELFGEAIGLLASVKHSELQLYGLYNMAHVDWETGAWESGAELYEATASLAQRIGADDVEIGASAGVGLCMLETGRIEAAREAHLEVEARIHDRPEWFQGREFAEALAIRLLLEEGRVDEAYNRYEWAAPMAEGVDLYCAAWLTIVCARPRAGRTPDRLRTRLQHYLTRVTAMGYAEMGRQIEQALAR